jgi:hypothetical protein
MRACLFLGFLIFTALRLPAGPAWQRELTAAKPGPWPALKPCVLDYQVSWKGMLDSGKLQMEFAPKNVKRPGVLIVRSTAKSTGAAAALFPHQSHFWSEIDPATLRPRYFHAVETGRRETVTTTVRHLTGRVESHVKTQPAGKGAAAEHSEVFRFSPVYDIFSAMLHVRSQKLAPGDRVTLAIHPFDNPYLLRVTVVGREIHLDRKTIRLSVDMRKIDRETLELRPYKKMKRAATLWLSDDEHRVPVELRAAVFIGDVRAVLTDFRRL